MIEIEHNKYGHNLLGLFWTYKPTGEEDQKLKLGEEQNTKG